MIERAAGKCELCGQTASLEEMVVSAVGFSTEERTVFACNTCVAHFDTPEKVDSSHWDGLQDAAWSAWPAVQAATWKILAKLRDQQPWAASLQDMMFVEEAWLAESSQDAPTVHVDANGNVLQAGDTVTLTQDLNVKGTSFTAKRGTAVRRIRLVEDNAEQIEGKVNDQMIVILTKYVKKSSE
ncbi:MAG: PhnA domain-containing protein [Saprospiraceae bacterium]